MKFLIFLMLISLNAPANASDSLSYTGRLANTNGSPVTGPVNLKVDLAYTTVDGIGTAICSKEIDGVELSNGVFHIKIDYLASECGDQSVAQVLAATPSDQTVALRVTDVTDTDPANHKTYPYHAIHALPKSIMSSVASTLVPPPTGTPAGHVLKWDGSAWIADLAGTGNGNLNDLEAGAGITVAAVDVDTYSVAISNVDIAHGGTGATTAADARTNLGLGTAAVADLGFVAGNALPFALTMASCLPGTHLAITAAPYQWTCTADSDYTKLPLAGGTMSGVIDMGTSHKITNLADPEVAGDAANKGYVDSRITSSSLWTESVSDIYRSTGNVGIGTTSPTAKLDITDGSLFLNHTGLDHGVTSIVPTTTFGRITNNNVSGGMNIQGFSSGANTSLALGGTIGTGGTAPIVLFANKSNGTGVQDLASTDILIQVRNNSSTKMTMLGSGNVGIGTTSPTLPLSITYGLSQALPATTGTTQSAGGLMRMQGAGGSTAVLDIGSAGGTGAWLQSTNAGALNVNYPLLINPNGGNVGVGTTTPNEKITVEGVLSLKEGVAPAATANYGKLYVKSDDSKLYFMDDAGVETALGSGTPAANTVTTSTIVDGTIVDADISGTAAIDQSKIANLSTDLATKQTADTDLTALSGLTTTGVLVRTADGAAATRALQGTTNRVSVTNGDGVAGNPVVDVNPSLLPSPVLADAGKFLKATGADTSVWAALASGDILTALGFTPINKAGDSVLTGTFDFGGTSVVRVLDPFGPTDAANRQWVESQITSSPNQWSESAGNVYRSTGNVGIGTSAPTQKVHINSGSTVGAYQQFTNSDSGNTIGDGFHVGIGDAEDAILLNRENTAMRFYTNNAEKMRIDSNGNVGIGTSLPSANLEVAGAVKLASEINSQSIVSIGDPIGGNNDTYSPINLFGSSTGWNSAYMGIDSPDGRLNIYPFSTAGLFNHLEVSLNAGGKMTVSGNVGIGTTSPSAKLDVASGSIVTSTSGNGLYMGTASQSYVLGDSGASGNLRLGTVGAERVRIDASGNMGIGTTSPAATLHVAGSTLAEQGTVLSGGTGALVVKGSSTDAQLKLERTSSSVGAGYLGANDTNALMVLDSTLGQRLFTIQQGGNVGIGIAAPAVKLDVNGSMKVNGDFTLGGPNKKVIAVNSASYTLPTLGTKMAFLNMADGSVCKILIHSSENSNYQPIELYLMRSAIGGTAPIISRESMEMHSHSNSVAFTSDTTGNIWIEKHTYDTGRSIYISRVEQLKGTCSVLDGTTTVAGTGVDQSLLSSNYFLANGSSIYYNGGNVGIGTTSPAGLLHTAGTNYNVMDRFGASSHLMLRTANGTAGAPTAILNGDNIGILSFQGYTGTTFTTTNTAGIVSYATENWSDTNQGSRLGFRTTGNGSVSATTHMLIDQNGNIGIGTSTPTSNLYVLRTTALNPIATFTDNALANNFSDIEVEAFRPGVVLRDKSTNADDFRIGAEEGKLYFSADLDDNASKDGASNYNDRSIMTLESSGNVGIGTTAPLKNLHINDSSGDEGNPGIFIQDPTATSAYGGALTFDDRGGANFIKMSALDNNVETGFIGVDRITGNVGIGTSTPVYKLDVVGDINASGSVRASGVALTSDIRLKQNLSPVEDSLEKLSKLSAYNYYWKDKKKFGDKKQLGLVAQDVEKVFPEAVQKGADGFLAVSYSNLVAPLIESVKELYGKFTSFEEKVNREIAGVKEENKELKAENAQMKAYLCNKDPGAPFCK